MVSFVPLLHNPSVKTSPNSFPVPQLPTHIYVPKHKLTRTSRWELLEDRGLRPTWTEPNLAAPGLCSEYTFINAKHPRNLLFQAIHAFE